MSEKNQWKRKFIKMSKNICKFDENLEELYINGYNHPIAHIEDFKIAGAVQGYFVRIIPMLSFDEDYNEILPKNKRDSPMYFWNEGILYPLTNEDDCNTAYEKVVDINRQYKLAKVKEKSHKIQKDFK